MTYSYLTDQKSIELADDTANLLTDDTGGVTPPTPAPTCTLSASPLTITSGQSTKLTWSSTNATSISGTNFSPSGVSGTATVSPTQNTTYGITVSGAGGSASATAAVNVQPVVQPAPTCTLTVSPTTIQSGQSASLNWSSTNATSVSGTNFNPGGQLTGTMTVTPAANTTYGITATGAGGTASATATLTVQPVTQPVPTCTISASPTSVNKNQPSTLTWSSANATSISGHNFNPNGQLSGSLAVYPTGKNTAYAITVTGAGGSASASVTVAVKGKPSHGLSR